jgi:hypothetical protein
MFDERLRPGLNVFPEEVDHPLGIVADLRQVLYSIAADPALFALLNSPVSHLDLGAKRLGANGPASRMYSSTSTSSPGTAAITTRPKLRLLGLIEARLTGRPNTMATTAWPIS